MPKGFVQKILKVSKVKIFQKFQKFKKFQKFAMILWVSAKIEIKKIFAQYFGKLCLKVML